MKSKIATIVLTVAATMWVSFDSYAQVPAVRNRIIVSGDSISPQLTGKNVEVLFDGAADLYCEVSSQHSTYYIIDVDKRLFTLEMPGKNRGETKNEAEMRRQGVISILKTILNKTPQLEARLESFSPGRHELVSLMHDYHMQLAGSASEINYELPPPAFVPAFGIFAGYNVDFIIAPQEGELSGFDMNPAYYPSAGFSFNAVLPRISRNLMLAVDLSLGERYLYGFSKDEIPYSPYPTVYNELHLDNFLLMTDLMIGYNFQAAGLCSFVSGGMSTRSVVSDNSRMDFDIYSDGLVFSDTYDYPTDEKTSVGLLLALGLNFDLAGTGTVTTAVKYSNYFGAGPYDRYSSLSIKLGVNF